MDSLKSITLRSGRNNIDTMENSLDQIDEEDCENEDQINTSLN